MNKYAQRGMRRIEDALDVPTNMLIRVLEQPAGVWPELQPEVGRVYPAVRGEHLYGYNLPRKGRPFCYIKIAGHAIILRGEADTGCPGEYEEVLHG